MLALAPGALAACGGTRQDAGEPSGTFDVSIVKASFPAHQLLAQPSTLTIEVRNDGTRPVPDLAVTVSSFSMTSPQPGLADPNRPVWIVDQGPRAPGAGPTNPVVEGNYVPSAGQTAYTNTWALGSVPPGETRTFVWRVTAVVPGQHTVSYKVAAGLNGKAIAQLSGGGSPEGNFSVNIAGAPPQSRVDPNTGGVIRAPPKLAGPSRRIRRAGSRSGSGTPGTP
jgi:hypothetical protein